MGLIRHLDKAFFLAILVLTIWYGWSRYEKSKQLRRTNDEQSLQVKQLKEAIEENTVPHPPMDPELYRRPIIEIWGRPIPTTDLSTRHFYPEAPKPRGWP